MREMGIASSNLLLFRDSVFQISSEEKMQIQNEKNQRIEMSKGVFIFHEYMFEDVIYILYFKFWFLQLQVQL